MASPAIDVLLVPAPAECDAAMAGWSAGREEMLGMTCRPVGQDGRRVAPAPSAVRLALLLRPGGAPCGRFTAFDFNPRNRSAEFGYLLAPALRGRGIGETLVAHGLDAWFRGSGLNKMHAQTAAFNAPSRRLLERLGLHLDGALREHHERDGALHDDLLYSLLRREWEVAPWRGCAAESSVAACRDAAETLGLPPAPPDPAAPSGKDSA